MNAWRQSVFFCILTTGMAAQPVLEVAINPRAVVDLPVSREITTLVFPGPITAIAGADMLIDSGKGGVDAGEDTPLRFHASHAPGSNFVLIRSLQAGASGRLTLIFEGDALVVTLHSVEANSVASVIFEKPVTASAVRVSTPPAPVKFSPRAGFSVLDRARAFPVLSSALPRALEGVALCAQNRKVVLRDLQIDVQEVYRFSKEDAVVFLLRLKNTGDAILDLAPATFAARVAQERFEQAIANGPRTLAPGESADAEFAIFGMPDGTRNDLSADNAFTILVNYSRREAQKVSASATPVANTGREPSS